MAGDKEAEMERKEAIDAAQWLRRDLMLFARDEQFALAFAAAMPLYWKNLYTIENAEEMSQDEAFRFFDWFVFDYQYEGEPRLIQSYYQQRYGELSSPQQKVLDRWLDAPPASAFELTGADGQMLSLREFITGDRADVYEPAGRGPIADGDLLLGRVVPVVDRLEFSTVIAYLPQDEIADLPEKIQAARSVDESAHPGSSYVDFMRRNGHLLIHHALEQAEIKGRPPVAAKDPNRMDNLTRKAARSLRKLQSRL